MSTKFIDDSYVARFLVVTDDEGRTLYREDTREHSNGWDADSIQRFRASSSNSEELQEEGDDGAAAMGTRWHVATTESLYWHWHALNMCAAKMHGKPQEHSLTARDAAYMDAGTAGSAFLATVPDAGWRAPGGSVTYRPGSRLHVMQPRNLEPLPW